MLVAPTVILWVGIAVYLVFALLIVAHALRQRGEGWGWGVLFGLLLATLPAWVWAMYWLLAHVVAT